MNSNRGLLNKKPCAKKTSIGGTRLIINWVIFLLLVAVLSYFLVFTVKYFTTDCSNKRSYLSYISGFNLDNLCENQTGSQPEIERKLLKEKEVFHVGHQVLTYDQAKCKCAAYGGRLATKNELINSYNKGAHWCSYGWTDGQNAYYPVQKCTWDDLQEDPKKKNSCGHPGINGGFFANPELKFGANCYGYKPDGTVAIAKEPRCEEKGFCERKGNLKYGEENDLDDIVPFNNESWSQYV